MFFLGKERRLINKYKKELKIINTLFDNKYLNKNEDELIENYQEIKTKLLTESDEIKKSIFFESVALAKRALFLRNGIELYDVQIIGILALYDNKIAEMKTGEGKTFVAIIAAFLKNLHMNSKNVYLITANDYLAERDSFIASKFFDMFNISVSFVSSVEKDELKKDLYNKKIIYTTTKSIIFDYLRDNLVFNKKEIKLNTLEDVIIDEADYVLIDEARTPFIITGEPINNDKDYYLFNNISKNFKIDVDFSILLKTKDISLTEIGYKKLESIAITKNLIKEEFELYLSPNTRYIELLINALKANYTLKENIDYLIKKNELVIVDQRTGRISEGSQYKNGIHQAVQAKEKVEIKKEQTISSSISIQNFFKKFKNVSGMTGTAKQEYKEFKNIYNLEIVSIETNKPIKRIDLEDFLFFTKEQKLNKLINDIKKIHKEGRPVLVGTNTIEYTETISKLLVDENIVHEVLNAKNHTRESEIIAMAGMKNAVTIATNMAGRGTDIILGGNKDSVVSFYCENKNISKSEAERLWKADCEVVKNLGGLYILGAERSTSRRLDEQLIGRSGRQGDNGTTCFYVSLDDDIIVDFSDNSPLKSLWKKLGIDNEAVNNKYLSSAVLKIQKTIDGLNHDGRKNMLLYDLINEDQRNIIFEFRNKILKTDNVILFVNNFLKKYIKRLVMEFANDSTLPENWKLKDLESKLKILTNIDLDIDNWFNNDKNLNQNDIIEKISLAIEEKIEKTIDSKEINLEILREITLKSIDSKWSQQLSGLNELRKKAQLRGYAQEKPLDEYRKEMFKDFVNYLMEMEEAVFLNSINLDKFLPLEPHEMDYKTFYNYVVKKTETALGIGLVFYAGV